MAPNPSFDPDKTARFDPDKTMTEAAATHQQRDPLGLEELEEELPALVKIQSLNELFAYVVTIPDSEISSGDRSKINNAKMAIQLRIGLSYPKLPKYYRITLLRLLIKENRGQEIREVPADVLGRLSS